MLCPLLGEAPNAIVIAQFLRPEQFDGDETVELAPTMIQ
jgi:hypothetical protein